MRKGSGHGARLTARLAAGLLGLVCLSAGSLTMGATVTVAPEPGAFAAALAGAGQGDTLALVPGVHHGPLTIDRPVTVIGEPGSIVDGGGKGRVITIAAPGVTVRGLTIVHSGETLATEDSGIFVTPEGDDAVIEGNRLEENLIGIYLKGPENALVRGNTIMGRRDLRVNERGNGVQLWNTPGSVVEGNDIRFGRDGIFVTTSRNNAFRDNLFRDLRFAVHYMYTNESEVSGNVSRGNRIGYALMFSTALEVHGNLSEDDRDRGMLLNYANNSNITGNVVRGGPEKCVFIYNANMNRIKGNRFESCDIGSHFTAGSERNRIADNAFIGSRTQVKYVGTRYVEWSVDGRGNYWSDNSAFDLDGDGIADRPYHPNDLVDQIVWRHPLAKMLLNSPALQVLRWSQSEFPALHPGGVTDSAPLMQAPEITLREES
jgi:nitrous oxidase accessory protein